MLKFKDIELKDKIESDQSASIDKDSIAVIGMACRLPMANNPKEFWGVLENGTDCIHPISNQRKEDVKSYYGYTKKKIGTFGDAAYIDSIDAFDAQYFKIPPKEAELMDPNQRLFLQVCWEAFEDAGYGGDCLSGSNTGIYVGYSGDRVYEDLVKAAEPELMSIALSGNLRPFIGGRIAYILDLKGPNMMIDTACSSSLVAIHEACNALNNKECELAIAGGVQIHIIPFLDVNIGVVSKDGRTRTFNADSTGTGTGEGVVALLLKPLSNAIKDRDNIHAIIKGSGVNYDGRSIGITAPNPQAQQEVILKACKKANISPEAIDYIEAHGTGTKLGDPIEIQGITNAFRQFTDKKGICAIGSVKTNIGHLDSSSGIAGVMKCILALKAHKIPPSLHMHRPNPLIDFINSSVYINDKLMDWKKEDGNRICGVSSFGITGTNCHLILEEAPKHIENEIDEDCNLLTVSADYIDALKKLVEAYLRAMEDLSEKEIADFCYTANIGRGHYACRIAVVFESKADLIGKMQLILENGIEQIFENGIFYGRVAVSKENSTIKVMPETENSNMSVAKSYIAGAEINWSNFYIGKKRSRLSIPVYPLKNTRYWVKMPSSKYAEHYYSRQWESIDYKATEVPSQESFLIIHNQNKQAEQIIRGLEMQGTTVVEGCIGKEYIQRDKTYELPATVEAYTRLLKETEHLEISHVVYIPSEGSVIHEIGRLDEWVNHELLNLFLLVKASQSAKALSKLTLLYYYDLPVEDDKKNFPEFEAMASVCRVSNQEYKKLTCHAICACNADEKVLFQLLNGLCLDKAVIKNGSIYQEKIKKVNLESLENRKSATEGKVFVILGGTGGIGQEISKYLSKKNDGCTIIWISRGIHDSKTQPTVEEIEKTGGAVESYCADIADYNSFIKVIEVITVSA